jgi:serine/threonine-protein kinase
VKLIRPESAGNPRALERFEHEVRATARLSDPNTVEIYDFGRAEDGTLYYVMELLHGLTLEELVVLHGPLPAGRVIYLMRQACDALAEAHAAGLIHRDLKPSNLFSARRGGRYDFVKLLDFGLVVETAERDPADADAELAGRGTPQYMAPEQVTGGRRIDVRTDLYAIGGILYLLLTGRAPFEGDTAAAVIAMQAHDPVIPPSRIRPDVPRDLETIVMRCLEKDPDQRFREADEVAHALASCAANGEWDAHTAREWWRQHGRPDASGARG